MPAQRGEHRFFDIGGLAFLDDEYRCFVSAKFSDFLGDERIGDVHAVDRHARGAKRVGEAELLQGTDHRVVQAALAEDAEILHVPGE
ncbi:MAG: hypothetical protein E6H47_05460, partial [Betaproteobacteria bacterium]